MIIIFNETVSSKTQYAWGWPYYKSAWKCYVFLYCSEWPLLSVLEKMWYQVIMRRNLQLSQYKK